MKKSHVMKVLPIALIVACLAGMPLLSACSSSESSKPEESVSEEPKYAVQIYIDCEKNLFFSKYDVDVMVDDEEVGNVEHGGEATFEVNLTKGQHELVLEEEDRTSPDGKTSFVVEGEGNKFAYKIHCTKDQIEIESIKEDVEAQEPDVKIVSYGGASIEVPSAWSVVDAKDGKYVYPEYGGLVYLHVDDLELGQSSADEAYAGIVAGLLKSGQYTVSDDVEKGKIGEAPVFKNEMTMQIDGERYAGKMELVLTEGKMYAVMFAMPDSSYDQHSEDIPVVLDSIKLDKPTAPALTDDSKSKESKESRDAAEGAEAAPKDTKSGIFEYCYVKHPDRKTENSYDIYYLFDEDTHTAVDFQTDGPEGIWTWPYRGNFNDGIELDLVDGGEVVAQWHAHWGAKNSPKTLIMVDDDGFESELEACPESEALSYFTDSMWETIGL
ncbi:MAG: hypothetical protein IJI12_08345 [Atopobiaceae bacterium]|nr:hypothetical protein [Atopobiaceae bacterium]